MWLTGSISTCGHTYSIKAVFRHLFFLLHILTQNVVKTSWNWRNIIVQAACQSITLTWHIYTRFRWSHESSCLQLSTLTGSTSLVDMVICNTHSKGVVWTFNLTCSIIVAVRKTRNSRWDVKHWWQLKREGMKGKGIRNGKYKKENCFIRQSCKIQKLQQK